MTTHEEISTCRRRNRGYWNQASRYIIAHIREARRLQDHDREAHCRRWLASSRKQRAEHAYLKDGL